jgi:hypothetical protein
MNSSGWLKSEYVVEVRGRPGHSVSVHRRTEFVTTPSILAGRRVSQLRVVLVRESGKDSHEGSRSYRLDVDFSGAEKLGREDGKGRLFVGICHQIVSPLLFLL